MFFFVVAIFVCGVGGGVGGGGVSGGGSGGGGSGGGREEGLTNERPGK